MGEIVTRTGKGSALTQAEMDTNINTLKGGFMDYNDTTTTGTPITLTSGVKTKLTNDGLGANTNKTYKPDGVTDLWNSTTNQFDFSELNLGDMVLIRFDVVPTTGSNNSDVDVYIDLGIDGGVPLYTLNADTKTYKNSGAQKSIVHTVFIYMGDTDTLNKPAEISMKADSNSSVIVNGWVIAKI